MTTFGAILFASLVMISCGDDSKNTALEKDAKAMADGICAVEKLIKAADTDPEKQKELEETGQAIKSEMLKMKKEMQEKYKDEKRNVFNLAFLEGLGDLMNHPTNDERYDKETCEQGWRDGKGHCEMIDKRRGTDIKKILAIDPEVLEWCTSI